MSQITMQLTIDAAVASGAYTDLAAANSAGKNEQRQWLQIDNEDGVAFYYVVQSAEPSNHVTQMVKVSATTERITFDTAVPIGPVWVYHATGSSQSFKLWEG